MAPKFPDELVVEAEPFERGGYATLHYAQDHRRGRRVVLKRPDANEEATSRFKREIEFGYELRHRNIIKLLDCDADGFLWYTMPVAEANLWKAAPALDVWGRFQAIEDVCQGLVHAHAASFVHRDVSPGNALLLDDDDGRRWVVSDFGLVRWPSQRERETILTRTGAAMGTPGFAAREVMINAKESGPAADVYSVGKLIAWLESGKTFVDGEQALIAGPWGDLAARMTEPQLDKRLPDLECVVDELASVRAAIEHRLRERWKARGRADLTDECLQLLREIAEKDGDATSWGLKRETRLAKLDVVLGLPELVELGFLNSRDEWNDQGHETYQVFTVTQAGFAVLRENRARLLGPRGPALPAAAPDDDVPF